MKEPEVPAKLGCGAKFFFLNDTATTEIYPLALHDALPISTSSVTLPVETPPIVGVSLVPLMVTVTSWLAEPSDETAVKESEMESVAPSGWIPVCAPAAL